jgi:toluene monooxygenase electron transfer component
VRLVAKRPLTPDMTEFTFQSEDAAEFLPGQYALLTLPGAPGHRAYSMANAANPDGQWRFIIRRVPGGRGTAVLFDSIHPGDTLELDGPYGHAYLRPDRPREVVCIAGGSGLAPMLAIADAAVQMEPRRHVTFFDGARTAADLCAAPLLAGLPAERLTYIPVLSAADGPWPGETGFVHEAVARRLPWPFDGYEFYFAGPPPMIDALQTLLMVEHRVPYAQIHFDRFV